VSASIKVLERIGRWGFGEMDRHGREDVPGPLDYALAVAMEADRQAREPT
jgi:hypothetical protein